MNFRSLLKFLSACLLCAGNLILADSILARESGWVPIEPPKNLKVPAPAKADPAKPLKSKRAPRNQGGSIAGTVYDNQPPITEKELTEFVKVLPFFREWTRRNGEEAHPVLTQDGRPDFTYSPHAAMWVNDHDFEARRFFCIMGRMAAGVVIVEEGNDFKGTRPPDMPAVSEQELGLVRKHLGELLSAGGPPPPIR